VAAIEAKSDEVLSSFAFNFKLRRYAEHEPHKRSIGQVLVDKLPAIRTVVNKTGETGGPFRTFEMEVLAGAATPPLRTST